MSVIVYLSISVNGHHAGWEGWYMDGETATRVRTFLKALSDRDDLIKSGLLPSEYPALNRWWTEVIVEMKTRKEQREHPGAVETLKAVGRKLLIDDVSGGQP